MPRETISAEAEAIRLALEHVGIAIGGLNPDPTQTIAQHQAREVRRDRWAYRSLAVTIIAALIAAISAATAVAAWVAPRQQPVPAPGSPWILWIGVALEGKSVVEWTNAVGAFEARLECQRAEEESDKHRDALVPQSLQRTLVRWVWTCFPAGTHPSGKAGAR